MKRIFVVLTCWRFILHWMYYKFSVNKSVIEDDLIRNIIQFLHKDKTSFLNFCELMTFYVMVRNIFYARVAYHHHFYAKFLSLLARPLPLLDISSTAEIGGGLIVQHGYATIIAPRKIGKDCWINQGVTIGYTNDNDCPTLGDNVTVYAGAKILGNITIHDNVRIGAGSVVVEDVPEYSTVIGVPGRIVHQKFRNSDGVLMHNRIPDPIKCEINRLKYEVQELKEKIDSENN